MDDILKKIEKLHAKAQRASTEAEANAFADKVQELLERYNLSMRDIEKSSPSEVVSEDYLEASTWPAWKKILAADIAKLYFCQMVVVDKIKRIDGKIKKRVKLTFYGKKHNTFVAKKMANYFFGSVQKMANDTYKAPRERRNFAHGCGLRLTCRIQEKIEKREKQSCSDKNALVVFNHEMVLIDSHLEDIGTNKRRLRLSINNLIALEGYEAGNKITIN